MPAFSDMFMSALEADLNRRFSREERKDTQSWQSGEARLQRDWSSSENALGRDLQREFRYNLPDIDAVTGRMGFRDVRTGPTGKLHYVPGINDEAVMRGIDMMPKPTPPNLPQLTMFDHMLRGLGMKNLPSWMPWSNTSTRSRMMRAYNNGLGDSMMDRWIEQNSPYQAYGNPMQGVPYLNGR